jgi:hypothetical protein
MILITAVLALSLCQDPPQDRAVVPVKKDVIHLVGGEQISGKILQQRDNYIEVRLDEGTIIGFERSRVRSIVRGDAPAEVTKKSALGPRDEWYLLHNEKGLSAGYMHALVQIQRDGSVRVSEEWYFTSRRGRIQVTVLEFADENLLPKKSFYHERVITDANRLVSERLLDAEIAGPNIVVRRRSLKGHDEQTYRFAETARFPLSYREELRQSRGVHLVAANQELFDSRTGQFRIWNASSVPRRKVKVGGKEVQVRELSMNDGTGANTEWIDAHHKVVRREVNGAALVAVRVTKERALRAVVSRGPTGHDAAIVANEKGDMAMWLPNPIWRAGRKSATSVSIEAPLYEGTAILMTMDQIPSNVQLDSAADHIVRWLKLSVGNDIKVEKREGMQVQRAAAVRLRVRWFANREGGATAWQGVCHVFRVGGRYAALFCSAPKDSFDDLDRDFRRVLSTVQLDSQDIEPTRQGPLVRRKG